MLTVRAGLQAGAQVFEALVCRDIARFEITCITSSWAILIRCFGLTAQDEWQRGIVVYGNSLDAEVEEKEAFACVQGEMAS